MKPTTAARVPNLRRAYFESRFGQLHCRTAFPSTGGFDELTPLIMLHDAPGSGALLADLLPTLGQERSVYLPDLPGSGESDGPVSAVPLSDYGAAIGELLRGLRLREVDVLGTGLGAAIAVELARHAGAGVRRLVLVQPLLDSTATTTYSAPVADGSHLLSEWRQGLPLAADAAALARHSREVGRRLSAGPGAFFPLAALTGWSLRERATSVTASMLVLAAPPGDRVMRLALPGARVEALPAAYESSAGALAANLKLVLGFLDR